MLHRGHSGDGCDLASTLCKYDLRKGDLFVMTMAMVRRVSWEIISSELLMCGGGVRSILLLPYVARCLETIDVCVWRMFAFIFVIVTVFNVRLPTLSPNQPLTWFRRAELNFHLKRITVRTTKVDYTIEVFPESVIQHSLPWLVTHLAEIKYEDMKAMLLKKFYPTSSVRARRILDLP